MNDHITIKLDGEGNPVEIRWHEWAAEDRAEAAADLAARYPGFTLGEVIDDQHGRMTAKVCPPGAPFDPVATWRERYIQAGNTSGRATWRRLLVEAGATLPTAEEIAAAGGPPELTAAEVAARQVRLAEQMARSRPPANYGMAGQGLMEVAAEVGPTPCSTCAGTLFYRFDGPTYPRRCLCCYSQEPAPPEPG